MTEIWKPISGCPEYEVSNLGRARRVIILKPNYSSGYPYITARAPGVKRTVRIHIQVCKAFNGPPPSPEHEVAHQDGNPSNARADNLVWKTRKENAADKWRHGTAQIGVRNGHAKLTPEIVRQVRKTYRPRKFGLVRTARKFGIGKRTVLQIVRRETWTHIPTANGECDDR
jgi:hypothetical protein